MKSFLTLAAILGSAQTTLGSSGHIINQVSSFSQTDAGGLSDITFPVQLGQVDHSRGYYFAQTWYFDISADEQAAYIGLQPRSNSQGKTVLHAAFSSFVAGTKSSHPNCSDGADDGSGVSCAIDVQGASYDTVWNLVVESTGSNTWRGRMVDSSSGASHEIGIWTIPESGLISKSPMINFFEWYPFNTEDTPDCSTLPKASVTFYLPTSDSGSGASYDTPYEVGSCKRHSNAAWKELSDGAWFQSAGFT